MDALLQTREIDVMIFKAKFDTRKKRNRVLTVRISAVEYTLEMEEQADNARDGAGLEACYAVHA